VLATAFKNAKDSTFTIVLINNSDAIKNLEFSWDGTTRDFRYYRTSNSENCKDLGLFNSTEVVLTPQSINTLVCEGFYEDKK
jgi:hypothetical protein